jgi:PAS domain S-box-containing protein
MFGYQPEELVGWNYLDLTHPEDRDHSRSALKEALSKPQDSLQWDARIRRKDSSYSWVENMVSNLLSESDVQAIVVNQREIGVRMAAEVERQRQADELARQNARLQEFAHTAAHDLREPLRAICSYTEMLVGETQMDAGAKQMAGFIVDGATRMSALIDDLLTFASTGIHAPPEQVDLHRAVAQATLNLAREIKESGANIRVDRLPVVHGNELHLVRLFQNLIGNAVKHRGKELPEIHVSAERRGPDWVIKIEDHGIGIAPENQARVFLPFVRLAKRDVPGSGLGLAVCKNIVEGLGGTISVESELGSGSTFAFTIAAEEAGAPLISVSAAG